MWHERTCWRCAAALPRFASPPADMGKLSKVIILLSLSLTSAALAQELPSSPLPEPSGRPLEIDFAADPILRLRREQSDFETFRNAVAAAVIEHPSTAEGAAGEDEALGALEQAEESRLPTVDINLQS